MITMVTVTKIVNCYMAFSRLGQGGLSKGCTSHGFTADVMMMMTLITTVGIVKVVGECDRSSLTLLLVILDAYHRLPPTTRLVTRNPKRVFAGEIPT